MSNTCNPKWRGGNIDSLFRWRLEGGGFVFSFLVVYQYYPNFFYNEDRPFLTSLTVLSPEPSNWTVL